MSGESTPRGRIDIVIPAYRAERMVEGSLAAWQAQTLPDGFERRIYVTDDASVDRTGSLVEQFGGDARLVRHTVNQGRAIARNSAIATGRGTHVLLTDVDCQPADAFVLARLVAALTPDVDGVLGVVERDGDGFWARYARDVARARLEAAHRGELWKLSTQIALVRRSVLAGVGGFDPAYRAYGFEDRDLLLRLLDANARLAFAPDARVRHRDTPTVARVLRKIRAAGASTSTTFRNAYPARYRQLPYARVDVREMSSNVQSVARRLAPPIAGLTRAVAVLAIDRGATPYPIARLALRAASAAAYLAGTCEADVTPD